MLYKIDLSGEPKLQPVEFQTVGLEKQLEDLLAANLLDTLYENDPLLPIFQERQWQGEADIYALNADGDLVIFELKRGSAGSETVYQALRYCEASSRWGYDKLEQMLRKYAEGSPAASLQAEHQRAFELTVPLDKANFNRSQHIVIVGSAADEGLVDNVEYWRSRGLPVTFLPYRVYRIGGQSGELYFEFFTPPHDRHANPADLKGVLVDTCATHEQDALGYMVDGDRVAAFGNRAGLVDHISGNDYVFLYHKGVGVIGAGVANARVEACPHWSGARFRRLDWIVKPRLEKLCGLSTGEIRQVVGHNFFWARTLKTPYLTTAESKLLVEALKARQLEIGP
jgi:hypothetical protein